ncbi:protein of unknown function [Methylorubrum extorquens]|uniref:Uncharacterized protein n=1 Tax=Methylorubrum extorquens TaxID=408 RepID=A0A2N9AJI7_METEX|nr:protein of unknown function [Methylorubrum extorquens]
MVSQPAFHAAVASRGEKFGSMIDTIPSREAARCVLLRGDNITKAARFYDGDLRALTETCAKPLPGSARSARGSRRMKTG